MIRGFLRSGAEFLVKSVCACDTRVTGTVNIHEYWNAAKETSRCGAELDCDDPVFMEY